ncbi:condensin complex subunit 1 [Malassezia pachydermatis]|uniref:Condensin complex subunit 1 n=1 Tax=Malassezia pachydermatis TaxID=77020 RepID=A0A0M9VQY1_9BASI|nr:condensin complex subunit 1 [Malassezia pachydermatis]KOS15882.1 condensin complex subunit 1 [Malassezia pachydermatis]
MVDEDAAASSFVLADQLLRLQEDDLDIDNDVPIDTQSTEEQWSSVTHLVDAMASSSTAVVDGPTFGLLLSCIKHVSTLSADAAQHLLDAVLSGQSALLDELAETETEPSQWAQYLEPLERYAFALQWLIMNLEKSRDTWSSSSTSDKAKTRRPAARRPSGDGVWTWTSALPRVLGVMAKTLRLVSDRIWPATSMRDTYVSRCYLRPVMLLLENEAYVKVAPIKTGLFKVLCLAVKQHGQAFTVQTSIMQALQYYEHLSEPMAELLSVLRTEFDVERLGEDVLRDLAAKTFTSLDTKSPRSFGRFLVRMAELNPRSVLKQVSLLQKHLDSESYPMRNAMIEVQGLLIKELCLSEDMDGPQPRDLEGDDDDERSAQQKQIDMFFERLFERFLDLTTFVRTKVIQVCGMLCELPVKFPTQRLRMTTLAVQSLEDKSSNVRRNAIGLLVKLLLSHPYGALHGGELDVSVWEERYRVVEAELARAEEALTFPEVDVDVEPSSQPRKPRKSELDVAALAASQQAMTQADQDKLVKLRLTKQYYRDALQFMERLTHAMPILQQLLASTNKAEVLESMEFFRVAYEYKLPGASAGVRAMVHLIWTKDNTLVMEDGSQLKGIRSRLIDVYRSLYFDTYADATPAENTTRIARNMIERTFGATLAELTSMEQLFSVMQGEGFVDAAVIDMLWDVYASPRPISRAQRRGAIMVLSMLAKADRTLVAEKIDVLLRMGLGPHGQQDLVLAQYSCMALQRVSGSAKKVKGALSDENVRYPMQHPMFVRLRALLEMPSSSVARSPVWFAVAEHAIDAIYLLGEQPDALCTEILRSMTLAAVTPSGDAADEAFRVAQWLFALGHIALKQTVYLELVEREYKRRKAAAKDATAAATTTTPAAAPASDLDQVAEQAEDDIGEVIALIRDRELLYGPESLLAMYGPVVVHICTNSKTYSDVFLRRAAALTLCKLMCISAEFCDAHMALLLHLLRSSTDAVVRANAVIGLGDIAVCFGTIVDENSGRLYAGLGDSDLGVKKNTLMVLTHLILNGMIKVKGQLGELAKCLEDTETRVSDLAKLFFSELATKENAVYNNLPDIISHLSSGENAVDEATFVNTMRFIFTFIDKERQAENVIEKLCQRFRLTTEERQWRDIAYCLSLLPYRSERSIKKLLDGVPHYQDKLYVPEVYQRFQDILTKMHQGKVAEAGVREFEDVLHQANAQATQDSATTEAMPLDDVPAEATAERATTPAPADTRRRPTRATRKRA